MGANPAHSLGQAGKLEPGESEATQAIRRRLNAAAELLGVSLEVGRASGAVYFWASEVGVATGPARTQANIPLSGNHEEPLGVLAVDLSSAASSIGSSLVC